MSHSRAVIFDMDGVIVDSEPRHQQAFLEVFDEIGYGTRHGIHFPDYYGRSDRVLWEDFIARHQPPQTLDNLTGRKQARFLRILREAEPIFPGLPELIDRLSRRYALGLASGSPHVVIEAVLNMRALRRYFPVCVSAEDVPRGKPHPDIFLHTARQLRVHPEDCWVIEDSTAGVEAARSAGMQVIAITNSLPADQLSGAHHVVDGYEAIGRILEIDREG